MSQLSNERSLDLNYLQHKLYLHLCSKMVNIIPFMFSTLLATALALHLTERLRSHRENTVPYFVSHWVDRVDYVYGKFSIVFLSNIALRTI